MKKKILPILFLLFAFSMSAQFKVSGGSGVPLKIDSSWPDYGIPAVMQIYLLNGMNGAEVSYTSSTSGNHQWHKYKDKAANSIPVASVQVGNTSTITNVEPGWGYFVGDDELSIKPSNPVIWIIDYSQYVPKFNSLTVDNSGDDVCSILKVIADIDAEEIQYVNWDGASKIIKRKYAFSYHTKEWNAESYAFYDKFVLDTLKVHPVEIIVDAPLQNTEFTLTGDNFAEYFDIVQKIKTPVYEAVAVEFHIKEERIKEDADNEQQSDIPSGDLGGSAPIDITLTAYANEPVVVRYNWTVYKYNEQTKAKDAIAYSLSPVLHHNFDKSGIYEAVLEVNDRTAVCIKDTTYKITISEFDLKIPNAFSPLGSPGKNDIFKVSYKSLVSFKAWIFDRWGNQLFYWTDPSQGWDGRVRGKFVSPGVYYYVIEARGASSTKVKRYSGDINILKSKSSGTSE